MSGIGFRKHLARLGLSASALTVGLLTSQAAFAQDAANPGAPDNTNVQANGDARKDSQIIVTG